MGKNGKHYNLREFNKISKVILKWPEVSRILTGKITSGIRSRWGQPVFVKVCETEAGRIRCELVTPGLRQLFVVISKADQTEVVSARIQENWPRGDQ